MLRHGGRGGGHTLSACRDAANYLEGLVPGEGLWHVPNWEAVEHILPILERVLAERDLEMRYKRPYVEVGIRKLKFVAVTND